MSSTAQHSIAQTNSAFVSGFTRRDFEAVANVYTEDARIFPPGSPPVEGKEAIRGFWAAAAEQMGVSAVQLTTVDLEERGDMAIEEGRFVLSGEAGTLDSGKYIVVWKRQPDGEWKWHRDIWNSNGAV